MKKEFPTVEITAEGLIVSGVCPPQDTVCLGSARNPRSSKIYFYLFLGPNGWYGKKIKTLPWGEEGFLIPYHFLPQGLQSKRGKGTLIPVDKNDYRIQI